MKNTQDTLLGFVLNLFVSLPEPRRRHCRVYPLEMLLFCAMGTFITGRKSFYDMNAFAEVYKDLLIELFGVSSTPSHDTFARIFRILDRRLSALYLQKFSEKIGDIMARHVVAIDGKTCREPETRPRKQLTLSAPGLREKNSLPESAWSRKKAMKFQRFRILLIFWGRL